VTAYAGASRQQFAAAFDLADPLGPNGPPSNVEEYITGAGKYGYQWVNYDEAYYTEYSYDEGLTPEGLLAPGVSQIDTVTQKLEFAVRHKQGKLYSVWVGVNSAE